MAALMAGGVFNGDAVFGNLAHAKVALYIRPRGTVVIVR